MARCPFARWRPLPENATAPRIAPTQAIFHTAVDAPGPTDLWRFFARADVKVESHFWVDNDGDLEQFMDTEVRADANFRAGPRAVSIETEDDGKPHLREWNPKQVETLIRLSRWLNETHDIPLRLCPSPTAAGFGWHAMWGAPSDWTPAKGKTCPGVARIPQIEAIIAGSHQALALGDRLLRLTDPVMRGPDVAALQTALTASGLACDADGLFGPGTDAQVRALQARHGLEVDGVVGPATLALFSDPDLWVIGEIREKWLALGGFDGFLGKPVTHELTCPDGVGRFNHFVGGSIYWTPQGGAWSVRGSIRAAWESSGWEQGPFGYPRYDEVAGSTLNDFDKAYLGAEPGEQVQMFERGWLIWNPEDRVRAVHEIWRA